ncbi:MAG: hypothetical protein ACLPRE_10070 [Limisphaerales bacterium]
MKIKSRRFRKWILGHSTAWLGVCGSMYALHAADTNTPAATPPPLTPEQMFEGGTNTYNNWIELGAGGFITSGNQAQAEQNQQSWNGLFGGIEDFHYGTTVATNTTLSADGHALFNNRDYKLSLDLEQQNIGFLRFDYDQFRTWENGDGGFYPPAGTWFPLANDALTLDNGTISFTGGLRLQNSPNVPQITFKYTHTYRNGEEPSTSWGYLQPDPNNLNTVRGLNPSFYAIDEHRDIFQLDATEHIKATDFGAGLRYETGNLNDALNSSQWPGQPFNQSASDQSSVSYGLFNAHAFSETWLTDNLMFSAAYSYSQLNNDFTGSYTYQPDLGVLNGFEYNNLNGSSWVQDHVVNLNLYAKLMKNLSLVPSLRIQKEDSTVDASEAETFQGTPASPPPPDGYGSQDDLEVSERLDATYTGITNWVLYARGEWTEGSGNLTQNGGLIPINGNSEFQSVLSQIDDNRLFQKYSAGVRWYPLYRVSLDVGGYYEVHDYNYSSTPNNSLSYGYPGFLAMQNFETYDGNTRLTLRPWQNFSIVGRYEYQLSTIHTEPDPISGLGDTESSRMVSHIIGADASWSPWSRLSLTAGFNYVISKTTTPVSDYVPNGYNAAPILAAQNNYWMVNFTSDFVVDDKTDLNVSYYYYQADNYDNNATVGVPYGAGAEEHAVTAEIVRRLTEKLRLTLKSGYYHYTDDTSGGNNDFDTFLIFASLQYRF